jgi:ADP-ribose pyrophosphatase YjhB (NUDIX family)
MRCTACGFLYYHNCAAAVAAIIETPSGIVTVRRASEPKKGFYDLPGGFVHYGETLEGALHREVSEEIGIGIKHLAYFGSFPNLYVFGDVTYYTTDAVFTCCQAGSGREFNPSTEIQSVEVIPPQDIDPAAVAFDSIRAALGKYVDSRGLISR